MVYSSCLNKIEVIKMNKCKCINGIIMKQIAIADWVSYPCDCSIEKELKQYEDWFEIVKGESQTTPNGGN